MRFSSAILPPWCRKSPKVAEVLPLLAHGDNAATPEDQARAAGYLQATAWVAERLLYQQDAVRDAEAGLEAGA